MIVNGKDVYGIIYKITNTVTNQSYIGQTKNRKGFVSRYYSKGNTLSERVYNYLTRMKELGKYYNVHLLNSMNKYGFDKFEVNDVLDTAMSRSELNEKEIYYIKKYDSYNNGFNKTPGGECGSCTEQLKGGDNPLSVAVCQLSLDGKLIKVWDSLADIRRSGLNVPNIEMTCQGVNSQSYGYLWVFKKDYDPDKDYKWKPSNNYKSIVLLDDDNNIIKEFVSIKEASDYLGIDRTTIRSACNNKWSKPKYNLKFKKDYKYIGEQRLNERTPINELVMQ